MMRTATTFQLGNAEIPVWFFDTYAQLEAFVDDLMDERIVVEVKPEFHPTISGVFYREYPLTDANATAAYKVAESDYPLQED